MIVITSLDHRENGGKDLFLLERIPGFNVGDDGRLNEVAPRIVAGPTEEHLSAFFFCLLDVLDRAVISTLVDNRGHVGRSVRGITHV
jgi:hypothetical protein